MNAIVAVGGAGDAKSGGVPLTDSANLFVARSCQRVFVRPCVSRLAHRQRRLVVSSQGTCAAELLSGDGLSNWCTVPACTVADATCGAGGMIPLRECSAGHAGVLCLCLCLCHG
jgi:hypothetical protein